MKRFFLQMAILFGMHTVCLAQKITYSDPGKENSRDIDFDIIGKMNGNILIYKNMRSGYSVSIYDKDMLLKEKVELDFISDKTFNTDVIAFPDFFYLVYQFQRKGVVHCMAVKMDGNAKVLNEPVELDTTQVGFLGDNKIYSTIISEDKQKILVFKIHRKNEKLNFVTLLYDSQLKLLKKSRQAFPYNDGRDNYSDFLLDNEGDLVFAKSASSGVREDINELSLIKKPAMSENFITTKLDLKDHYIDQVNLKIDNANKHYLVNSFYYKQKRGSIEGLYYTVWDKRGDSSFVSVFSPLDDSIRSAARAEGSLKSAFNDFYIRSVVVKRDGGFIVMAEKYTTQARNNDNFNRRNYYYNSPYFSPLDYYTYNPSYNWYYRRYNNFNNNQATRYFYDNVMLLSIDRNGLLEWNSILLKEQYDDDSDNYLSFLSFNTGSEIHFLFNSIEKKDWLLEDNSVAADGKITRYPTLKSLDRGYEFMPKYGKQVAARQVIIPCTYRNMLCFAKLDY